MCPQLRTWWVSLRMSIRSLHSSCCVSEDSNSQEASFMRLPGISSMGCAPCVCAHVCTCVHACTHTHTHVTPEACWLPGFIHLS